MVIEKIKEAWKYVAGAIVGAATVGTLILALNKPSRLEIDVNQDGRTDILLLDKEGNAEDVLIKKRDGIYDKCKLIANDGVAFYVSDNKFYDSWGHTFVR